MEAVAILTGTVTGIGSLEVNAAAAAAFLTGEGRGEGGSTNAFGSLTLVS